MKRVLSRATSVVATLALSAMATGCATVTRGTHEAWTINTVPPGASVKTSNGRACDSTPCTFQMDHRSEFDVTITKAGYKDWRGHVIHQMSTAGGVALVGNGLIGGVPGVVIDGITGAAQELKPNPLNVTLEPNTPGQ
jgi:hypothetical protein